MRLHELPNDLLVHVAKFLPIRQLYSVCARSPWLRRAADGAKEHVFRQIPLPLSRILSASGIKHIKLADLQRAEDEKQKDLPELRHEILRSLNVQQKRQLHDYVFSLCEECLRAPGNKRRVRRMQLPGLSVQLCHSCSRGRKYRCCSLQQAKKMGVPRNVLMMLEAGQCAHSPPCFHDDTVVYLMQDVVRARDRPGRFLTHINWKAELLRDAIASSDAEAARLLSIEDERIMQFVSNSVQASAVVKVAKICAWADRASTHVETRLTETWVTEWHRQLSRQQPTRNTESDPSGKNEDVDAKLERAARRFVSSLSVAASVDRVLRRHFQQCRRDIRLAVNIQCQELSREIRDFSTAAKSRVKYHIASVKACMWRRVRNRCILEARRRLACLSESGQSRRLRTRTDDFFQNRKQQVKETRVFLRTLAASRGGSISLFTAQQVCMRVFAHTSCGAITSMSPLHPPALTPVTGSADGIQGVPDLCEVFRDSNGEYCDEIQHVPTSPSQPILCEECHTETIIAFCVDCEQAVCKTCTQKLHGQTCARQNHLTVQWNDAILQYMWRTLDTITS